jgi:iron complex outermembrane recepter protein
MYLSHITTVIHCVAVYMLFCCSSAQLESGTLTSGGALVLSEVTVIGTIKDSSTGKSVVGATIQLVELKKGDVSHKDGTFHLNNFPTGIYTLSVRSIGYQEWRRKIHFIHDTIINISLAIDMIVTNEVLVSANKVNSSSSETRIPTILTEKDLDQHRGQTLGETLKNIGGVTLLQTGPSISKPVIRGLHSQRVVTINGGLQQEGQQWGQEHAPEIDPFSVRRVEILKGSAGVEYGAGAIGGVIRVDELDLPYRFDGLSGKAILTSFSNNQQIAGSLLLQGRYIPLIDSSAWRIQFSGRKAGDSHTPFYQLTNTGFQEFNMNIQGGINYSWGTLEAQYKLFSTRLGILSASHIGNINDLQRAIESGEPLIQRSFSYSIRTPKQEITHHLATVKSVLNSSLGNIELQYGFQLNDRAEFDAHNTRIADPQQRELFLQRPAMQLQLFTNTFDAKLRHYEIGSLSGVVGISFMHQLNWRFGRVLLIPDYNFYNVGVFAIENYTTGDWTFNAGARFDSRLMNVTPLDRNGNSLQDTSFLFSGFNTSLGVLRSLNNEIKVSLNLNTGFRTPNVNELYSNDVHHGTAQFEIGDKRLQPERSLSADAMIDYNSDILSLQASLFVNSIAGFINLKPDVEQPTVTFRGVFPTMRYVQNTVLMYGGDWSGRISLTEWMWFGNTLSIVRATNTETNEPVLFIPSDRIRSTLHFHSSNDILLSEPYLEVSSLLVRRQDRVPVNQDYALPPAGYGLVDIALGGVIELGSKGSLSLNAEIQNLFNQPYRDYLSRYRYFALDAGRNFILRIGYQFGSTSL